MVNIFLLLKMKQQREPEGELVGKTANAPRTKIAGCIGEYRVKDTNGRVVYRIGIIMETEQE